MDIYRKRKIKRKTLTERLSLFVTQSPDKAVLVLILLFNISFFMIAAAIISHMAPSTLKNSGFWPSVFYTITMILDAGCISFVIEDVGQTGVGIIILCLLIVLIGMITFTGAVIGYITNYISDFIVAANSGKRPLNISGHTILLNWNSRGSEIINDLLFSEDSEDVVILVQENREAIIQELHNKIHSSINNYNKQMTERARQIHTTFLSRWIYVRTHKLRNNLSIIIREGDALSKVQLDEISIEKAKTVFILGNDYQNSYNKYSSLKEYDEKYCRGNSNVIKTLMLVADSCSSETSMENQRIVVEVDDEWTYGLVNQIVEHKKTYRKSYIVPVPVNRILGKLMSQLALMPQLNQIYGELFSNRGNFFVSEKLSSEYDMDDVNVTMGDYLKNHNLALPLSIMETQRGKYCYYLCQDTKDVTRSIKNVSPSDYSVRLNRNYWLGRKNIIILGHNSGMDSLMEGFNSFHDEWLNPDGEEILDIVIIDTEESLEKHGYYKQYSYVSKVVAADIYDKDRVYQAIAEFDDSHLGDISILILSDDQVPNEEIDEKPLTYLIYIDDMIERRRMQNPTFDDSTYEIIIEILNPQNYEAIKSYNSNHIVISNRYISHMMTQIGERASIYDFFHDILTFDDHDMGQFSSKELYIKLAKDFFEEIPGKCTAHTLINAIFEAGDDENKSILMGYMPQNTEDYILFTAENSQLEVDFDPDDKLILCSNH